ncbi:hypothetical protein [Stenotrophomonas maltophilia]|jgi:hypothetical protein|uniref:hypothetical protein n=1 Tax=Stenotrophomonas maltophilia TaxID=40324 RepID=UPI003015C57A
MSDLPQAPAVPNRILEIQRLLRSRLVPEMQRWFIAEFAFLSKNVTLVGAMIEAQCDRYDQAFKEAIADMNSYDADRYADVMVEETAFIEMLPQLQWRSQYLMIYATFEHALLQIRMITRQRFGLPKQEPMSKQSALERTKRCMKDCGVQIDWTMPDIERIKIHSVLRNKVTHADGVFPAEGFKGTRVGTLPGVTVRSEDDSVSVDLGSETLLDAVASMHRFLLLLANYEHPDLA